MAVVAILDIANEQHTTRDLCKIPDPIQEEGSACRGGRQALPGGATGLDMIVGGVHHAEVFCNEFRRQHEQKFAV